LGFAFSWSLGTSHGTGENLPGLLATMLPFGPANTTRPSRMGDAERLAESLEVSERHLARSVARSKLDARPPSISKPADRPLSIGFYVNWDDNSYPALQRSLPHLDWVVPAWMALTGKEMALTTDVDDKALALLRSRPELPVLPLLQNSVDDTWDGAGLARLMADPQARAARLGQIVNFLTKNKFQGLTVDFEEVPATAQADLKTYLSEMSAAFKPLGLSLALAVPFDDNDWNYKSYAAIADYVILMAYDQHWSQGTPGSIAAQDWFETTLDRRMTDLDPNHTIVAIGAYGYDWVKGKTATDLTFQEAMQAATDSEAAVDFDPTTNNPHFSYVEDDGQTHDVWFLDGVTAYNQIHAADIYQPAGYAVWRIGSEDPSLWSVLQRPYGAPAPDTLSSIASGDGVNFQGQGEILRVQSQPQPGTRHLEINAPNGDIDEETYTKLPISYVVQSVPQLAGEIALTFDDGPDPQWTPQILDILKQKQTPATFFVIGENASSNPDLVRRIVDQGDEVGNHTYTHPNISLLPNNIAQLEINSTQRLVEALTGRSMRLFRPPYLGDSEPTTKAEADPIQLAQAMGYLTVGLKVDPDDWMRPDAGTIVDRVMTAVTSADPEVRGQVVLLHDAGGDRSQTVKALPALIDALRAKGFKLVTVSALAGLTRDQAMPPVPASALASWVDVPMFATLRVAGGTLATLFGLAIVLGLGRLAFLCILSAVNLLQDRRRTIPVPVEEPLVTVLIPAHNEALVIVSSIERVLASLYRHMEIVVIDDGSTDTTSELVRQHFAQNTLVTLITIPNGGKANALNRGFLASTGSIVVALDADTQFEPATIGRLARWFADETVGAVAGNAKVGNRVNLVTRWQALEYVTAQNLERRALAALGAITVVPGAVGAWRRSALVEQGGYPADTLAEDQDLTIAISKSGYRVIFDDTAVAWTEAPETFGSLAKQRFRWAFGTLQCLWKHKSVMLNPQYGALGLVAFPQVALFQIAFSLLSPLVDLLFVLQLLGTGVDYLQHHEQFDPSNLIRTASFFALFLLVDLAAAALAFTFERNEDWSLLLWLPLQRFGYRQLMYFVVVKSMLKALTGPRVGWGQLERRATVNIAPSGTINVTPRSKDYSSAENLSDEPAFAIQRLPIRERLRLPGREVAR